MPKTAPTMSPALARTAGCAARGAAALATPGMNVAENAPARQVKEAVSGTPLATAAAAKAAVNAGSVAARALAEPATLEFTSAHPKAAPTAAPT